MRKLQKNPGKRTLSKNTTEKASHAKVEFMFGADAVKSGLEKTAKLYESVGEFNKETLNAYVESATVFGKGLESIAKDSSTYAKKSIEDAITASNALMGSKSIGDAIEIQMNFAKTAYSTCLSRFTGINQTLIATAKGSSAPLQARVEAAAELLQSARS